MLVIELFLLQLVSGSCAAPDLGPSQAQHFEFSALFATRHIEQVHSPAGFLNSAAKLGRFASDV